MKIHCLYEALVDPSELKSHPKNRNKHPQEQLQALLKIIKYQGWRYAVKISKRSGCITTGHGRMMVAKLLRCKVPVVYQDYDSEEQEYADVQADNAIASWAELDLAGINSDIGDLGPDFDIDLLGIEDFVLEPADKLEPQCDEDEVPEQVEPKTKLGDIYKLGNHRLMCGDSTSIDAVEKLMVGDKADITFTSPPYNAGCFGFDDGKSKYKKKGDDDLEQDDYFDFLCSFTNIALEVSTYVFFNNQFLSGNRHALAKFFGNYAAMVKEVFPWIKNTAPPNVNKGVFTNRFEFFLCLEKGNSKKGFPVEWQGKFHNVIEGSTASSDNVMSKEHSATMPVYVPEWFLDRIPFVKTVYEPFGGSGTTAIVCEKTNRKCFMMELDPHYCDVIVARWEKYTGKKAELINAN